VRTTVWTTVLQTIGSDMSTKPVLSPSG